MRDHYDNLFFFFDDLEGVDLFVAAVTIVSFGPILITNDPLLLDTAPWSFKNFSTCEYYPRMASSRGVLPHLSTGLIFERLHLNRYWTISRWHSEAAK